MSREDMIKKLYHWICDEYVMVMVEPIAKEYFGDDDIREVENESIK